MHSSECYDERTISWIIKYFGIIYYDNPYDLENKNEARAIIIVSTWMHSYQNTQIIRQVHLLIWRDLEQSLLSIVLWIFNNERISYKYGVVKNLLSDKLCSIEFHDYSNNQVTIAFPDTTGNESILTLSGYSTPNLSLVH